jgi:hypothetical protein
MRGVSSPDWGIHTQVSELVEDACEDKPEEERGFQFLRTVRPDRSARPLFLGA